MPTMRNVERMSRIQAAAAKISAKIDADPKGPKAKLYKIRLKEYTVSLERLAAGKPEQGTVAHPRTVDKGWRERVRQYVSRNDGVVIEVPVDTMGMIDSALDK